MVSRGGNLNSEELTGKLHMAMEPAVQKSYHQATCLQFHPGFCKLTHDPGIKAPALHTMARPCVRDNSRLGGNADQGSGFN